ncbi:MAG: hypothetical protein Q9227_003334 [Pyrenula ochraceoflavens]
MGQLVQTLPDYRLPPYSYGQQNMSPHQFSPPSHTGQAMPFGSPPDSQYTGHAAPGNPSSFNVPFMQQYPFQSHHNQQQPRPYGQAFQNMVAQSAAPMAPNQMPYLEHQYIGQPLQQHHPPQQMLPGYNTPYYNQPQHPQHQMPAGRQFLRGPNAGVGFQYSQAPGHGMRMPSIENMTNLPPIRIPGVSGQQPSPAQNISRQSSDTNLSPLIPRGPPRKPRQSGHALWVGNLPPGATVYDLKEHFSKGAMHDIESVFLISKSNCAFVNYKSESACASAMGRFHDSRFHGVRLVCRLRRGSAATPAGTPTGPSMSHSAPTKDSPTKPTVESESPETGVALPEKTSSDVEDLEGETRAAEKYFVVKSLTIEDLELSARNGIWATQAHNEAALNKAFKTAENVYLIFSANKSGEYFGYARMVSAIDEDATASISIPASVPESAFEADLPHTIPTPATDVAPKGRVIDDSARGTIFWEADPEEEQEAVEEQETEAAGTAAATVTTEEQTPASAQGTQTFGKPFRIEWISTTRLPFYRTRGLRNPWNANREVKIARDGTELEPIVGRRLVGMFHRPQMGGPSPPRPI